MPSAEIDLELSGKFRMESLYEIASPSLLRYIKSSDLIWKRFVALSVAWLKVLACPAICRGWAQQRVE